MSLTQINSNYTNFPTSNSSTSNYNYISHQIPQQNYNYQYKYLPSNTESPLKSRYQNLLHSSGSSSAIWKLPKRSDAQKLKISRKEFIKAPETDEFEKNKLLGGIIAFFGLSGLVIPLLTIASIPFQLLNPNLLIAKSIAFLSLPVALKTFYTPGPLAGRNGQRLMQNFNFSNVSKFLYNSLEAFDSIVSKLIANETSRGFVIIQRNNNDNEENSTLLNTNSSKQTEEVIKTTPLNLLNKTEPLLLMKKPDLPDEVPPEQCLQRIACEGFLNSLPQLILNTVLKGQLALRSPIIPISPTVLHGGGEIKTNKALKRVERALLEPLVEQSTSRKKHLAKYALNRVKNSNLPPKTTPPPPPPPTRTFIRLQLDNKKSSNKNKNKDRVSNNLPVRNSQQIDKNNCSKFKCSLMQL